MGSTPTQGYTLFGTAQQRQARASGMAGSGPPRDARKLFVPIFRSASPEISLADSKVMERCPLPSALLCTHSRKEAPLLH